MKTSVVVVLLAVVCISSSSAMRNSRRNQMNCFDLVRMLYQYIQATQSENFGVSGGMGIHDVPSPFGRPSGRGGNFGVSGGVGRHGVPFPFAPPSGGEGFRRPGAPAPRPPVVAPTSGPGSGHPYPRPPVPNNPMPMSGGEMGVDSPCVMSDFDCVPLNTCETRQDIQPISCNNHALECCDN